jgi:hypothetical protein
MTGRDHTLPIRTEFRVENPSTVRELGRDGRSGLDVPETGGGVVAGCEQTIAVGAECDVPDGRAMCDLAQQPKAGIGEVPDRRLAVAGARGRFPAVWAECEAE